MQVRAVLKPYRLESAHLQRLVAALQPDKNAEGMLALVQHINSLTQLTFATILGTNADYEQIACANV